MSTIDEEQNSRFGGVQPADYVTSKRDWETTPGGHCRAVVGKTLGDAFLFQSSIKGEIRRGLEPVELVRGSPKLEPW